MVGLSKITSLFGAKVGAAFVLGLSAGTPAHALDGEFHCHVKSLSSHGWIPREIHLSFKDGWKGEVSHDGNFSALSGQKLSAGFFEMGPTSYRISWLVKTPSFGNGGDLGEIHYRAILNTRNMKLSVQVISDVVDVDQPRGVGECSRLISEMVIEEAAADQG